MTRTRIARHGLLLLLAALAGAPSLAAGSATDATIAVGDVQVPITVRKPDGPGPFPAVVIMHDCSGLGPRSSGSPGRWAKVLVAQGYVVLLPDSFTPRGFPNGVCTETSPDRLKVNQPRRVPDAYAALAYARTLPYVDGRRIGIMGGSHGGGAVLFTLIEPESPDAPLAREKQAGFAAAVALYPGCNLPYGTWRRDSGTYRPVAPLLILAGEKDDWTPAEPCVKLAGSAREAGYDVTIKVYPDAHHAFDSDYPVRYVAARNNANAPGGRGATTGGNPAAWADSIREVTAFFGRMVAPAR